MNRHFVVDDDDDDVVVVVVVVGYGIVRPKLMNSEWIATAVVTSLYFIAGKITK